MRPILTIILATAAMAPAMAAPVKMDTTLSGAAEAPNPGDAKGSGTASLTFDSDKNQVCYMLHASGTDTPTMAHIHKAAAGKAGPVVVPLDAPANGMSQGCKPVAADLLGAILASPADYYVNVHTAAFPAGAIRGQLAK
ncbi:CHRD domain-containing protein [Sphingomonas quercus]|uniref:CHRD domain-containing protein n=1 Tax=Sphingomonas quercus TaxID=2842451 RepID=A0ABS6BJB3_9SPHN|nr:CHRD domain-containing protein [Sphingomonas quercus]MBU3077906.1 CHRD domain-containing protein [Sphingomonas quercus]